MIASYPDLLRCQQQAQTKALIQPMSTRNMSGETLVARDNELAQIESALQQALQNKAEVVFVTGKAGSGKSSLLEAFAGKTEALYPNVLAAYTQCARSSGAADPFQPFDDLVQTLDRRAGQLSCKWLWRTRLRHMANRMRGKAKSAVGLLGSVLGLVSAVLGVIIDAVLFASELGSPATETEEKTAAYRVHLKRLAAFAHHWPVLLLIDDFHHADVHSCNLLIDLRQRLEDVPLLVVVAFRDLEVKEGHPLYGVSAELKTRMGAHEIRLDDLIDSENDQRDFVDRYLDAVYQPNTFGDAFRSIITVRTEGLPWHVVEIMKLCEERQWIHCEEGCWSQAMPLGKELPRSLWDFIRTLRWEPLALEDRNRLTVAAVGGEVFSLPVIALALDEQEAALQERLDEELVRKQDWLEPVPARLVARRQLAQYRFVHTFYFEFVDRQLEGSLRSEWHGRIGSAKKQIWAENWKDIAGELALHFEAARNWQELMPCLEQQLRVFHVLDAREAMATVLLKLGDCLRQIARPQEALMYFGEAEELARANGLQTILDNAWNGQAWILFEDMSNYAAAEPLFREIASRQAQKGVTASRRLLIALAVTQLAMDQLETARASFDQALRPDESDVNDRLDNADLIDGHRWLLRLHDSKPETPGVIEALQHLHVEIGDLT